MNVKNFLGCDMKGMTIADTIGIFVTILSIFLFFTQIFPKIIETIIDLFSKTAAESVARQLAAFITVSGVSTYKINITYTPTKKVTYNIQSDNRLVKVVPNYATSYGEKSSSSQPYATPPNSFGPFSDVNTFIITKTFSEEGSKYEVQTKKTE